MHVSDFPTFRTAISCLGNRKGANWLTILGDFAISRDNGGVGISHVQTCRLDVICTYSQQPFTPKVPNNGILGEFKVAAKLCLCKHSRNFIPEMTVSSNPNVTFICLARAPLTWLSWGLASKRSPSEYKLGALI